MKLTKKNLGRAAAAFLATAMLASFTAIPTFAEPNVDQIAIKKVIDVTNAEKASAPNTSFTFTVTEGMATTENGVVIDEGVKDAVYFEEGDETITFTPADDAFNKSTYLTVDQSKFEAPGIYRYIVTETEGNYDGMTYDTTNHTLDVYVTNKDAGFDFKYIFDGEAYGTGEGKTDGSITNTYVTHSVTVGKTVEGNQGDKNKDFMFTITINGADDEQYTLVKGGIEMSLTSGTAQSVTLKSSETFTVYGLSENDTYTIAETDYSAAGYTTKYDSDYKEGDKSTDKDVVPANTCGATEMGNTDASVMFYNIKNISTPTGIVMNVAPYVLLVVVAAAGCLMFLRKRHNED